MRLLGFLLAMGTASLVIAGCASNVEEEEMSSTESELNGARSVSLKYEGTCEFLRSCSKYSRGLPAGQVTWGCTGVGACSDSALWVAGPNKSYCGKTVRICKGSTCTNAVVKDTSVTKDWEASNGVLDALDLPHGLTGKCGGFGGGKVTVEVGGKSAAADDDDAPAPAPKKEATETPAPTDEARDDDGCYSATLERDMDELTCVQSASTEMFYQCKAGKWYRGTSTKGPYGACTATHALED